MSGTCPWLLEIKWNLKCIMSFDTENKLFENIAECVQRLKFNSQVETELSVVTLYPDRYNKEWTKLFKYLIYCLPFLSHKKSGYSSFFNILSRCTTRSANVCFTSISPNIKQIYSIYVHIVYYIERFWKISPFLTFMFEDSTAELIFIYFFTHHKTHP